MTAIVAGVYKQGKLQLLETPLGLREGRVRVTLTEELDTQQEPLDVVYGKYKGEQMSTLEDFREAEWHGEEDWDASVGR